MRTQRPHHHGRHGPPQLKPPPIVGMACGPTRNRGDGGWLEAI